MSDHDVAASFRSGHAPERGASLVARPPSSSHAADDGDLARALARELLTMTQEEFSRAFGKSPMKRAKLRGLTRNAAVVLRNAGTSEDVPVLSRALDDEEPLVREHAAWALARLRDYGAPTR